MKMPGIFLLFSVLIGVPTTAFAVESASACDVYAAYPADKERPHGVSGVIFESINARDAIPACEAALEQSPGNARYHYQYGRALVKAVRYTDAFNAIQQAATQGYSHAIAALGYFYFNGRGVPRDREKAVVLFQRAAKQGSALGQHNLAVAYRRGFGVPQSHEIAASWYRKAAEQGDARALLALARSYVTGRGVPRDHKQAEKLFRESAELGHSFAQYELGIHYAGEHDVRALKWFTIAASYGNNRAPGKRDAAIEKMTAEQIELAETMAREWLSKFPP